MASQYRRRSLMLNTIAKVAQGNPTIITDSSSRRLQKLNIYGQSEQDSTTGTNFLSDEDKRKTINNVYYYENVGFNLKSGTKYILNASEIVNGLYFMDYVSKEILAVTYQSTKVEYTPEEDKTVYLNAYKSPSLSDDVLIWLNVGEYSEYEPYTGGKPSPSPDYPQEIISKEVSEIRVTNGADLSQTITLTEPITLRGIPVSSGGNITIDGKQYVADYIDSLTGKVNRLNGYIDSYNGEEVGTIFMSTTGQLTTGAKVIYKLSQPTQEDLPQQDQEAIRALTTYYPNTVIQTGCWNEVTYSAKRGG